MSADVYTPLAAAFVASILTSVGSRWIAGVQAKKAGVQQQVRIDADHAEARRQDERNLRDAKRERLRGDFVAVAWAAENVGSAAKQLGMLLAGDTPEARDERIQKQLEDAHVDLGRAMIRLRLEEGAQPIVDAYQRVRGNWFQYQWQVPEADRNQDHSEVLKLLLAMEADVEGIVTTAKADLDRLGQAI
ncbi:MAG: hypothetical protein WD096_01285 [Actinomycetota bacterium]